MFCIWALGTSGASSATGQGYSALKRLAKCPSLAELGRRLAQAAVHHERILVVEDDPKLSQLLCHELQRGYQTVATHSGSEALFLAETQSFDLILLDRNLPDMDGLRVAEQLQGRVASSILMLTARSDVTSRVEGIYAGASDYLTKPFSMQELMARIYARLRERAQPKLLSYGFLSLDVDASLCSVAGQALELTEHEFELLSLLLSHRGRVFSRSDLEHRLYGESFPNSNTVEVFISKLRSKLAAAGVENPIQTVRGRGYVVR